MMTFLALAAKMNWPVSGYTDNAVATLGKNSKGKMSVTNIELNPKIEFSNGFSVNENKNEKGTRKSSSILLYSKFFVR